MKKEIFTVQGMSCEHCVRAVENAVKSVAGVASIKVDLKTSKAEVEFDDTKATLDKIKKAATEEGYSPVEPGTKICMC